MEQPEIPRVLIDYERQQTSIVVRHSVTSLLGEEKQEHTLVLDRVEDWTRETIAAAAVAAFTELASKKTTSLPTQGTLKLSLPV